VELRDFMHWFRTQGKLLGDGHSRRMNVLNALRQVVTDLVPEFSNLRIVESPRLGLMVDKRDQALFLHQLSDGERGLLALVFDLTRRLAIANPESDDPIHEGEALVMIDEIELHLHPKWQRLALRRLTNTFKKCQFVVTTHSPQVIGQVLPEQLRLLSHDESGRIVVSRVSQSFGMDSSWILQNILGVPSRDYETEQRLSAIYRAIDEDEFGTARKLADALQSEIGDFPDLQEAFALLDRFDLLGTQ
jgi:predicted ATP-binding protein involved in virulence